MGDDTIRPGNNYIRIPIQYWSNTALKYNTKHVQEQLRIIIEAVQENIIPYSAGVEFCSMLDHKLSKNLKVKPV